MSRRVESYLPVIKQARGYYSNYPVYALVKDTGGQVYNVQSYGATGLGLVNDTVAFNKAITAGAGSTVYVPTGTYLLTPGVLNSIPSNTQIIGAGGAILKIPNAYNGTNNLLQVVSANNVLVSNLVLDGNRTNQSGGTQYGFYLSTSTNCTVQNVTTKNFNGDGHQLYNCTGCLVLGCTSTNNVYHGFEAEQCTGCRYEGNRGYSNTLHGLLISPGEVASQGSSGNTFMGNVFDLNAQYGIAVNADNGDVGKFLSGDNIIANNIVRSNTQYGINIYKQNNFVLTGNDISLNGFFGIYLFESANNVITNNFIHNNSQVGTGSYDEILMEGYSSDNTRPAKNNIVTGNLILIDGTTMARYAISEGTANDGPNTISGNIIPSAGSSGKINSQFATDVLDSVYRGTGAPGITAPQGSIYARTDGNSSSTRLYVNTNGSTGWVAITTAS